MKTNIIRLWRELEPDQRSFEFQDNTFRLWSRLGPRVKQTEIQRRAAPTTNHIGETLFEVEQLSGQVCPDIERTLRCT